MIPIVFWNLASSSPIPVASKNSRGVVLLSGFSAGLLSTFLSGKLENFTPIAQLTAILTMPAYAELKVVEDE
jgi:hypothetical protein